MSKRVKYVATEADFAALNIDICKSEFDNLRRCDKVNLRCRICNKDFKQTKNIILKSFKAGCTSGFCSPRCSNGFKINKVSTICEECGEPIIIRNWQAKKYKHNFCSYSCSARYRNRHKTTGFIRSKIESYIEGKIKETYPSLELLPNDRILLDGLELDFYLPKLKLGIELNGITHYEPIYGVDRFTRSLENDKRKMCLCYEKGVELAIVNISQFKYFTEECRQVVWEEVNRILMPLEAH